MKHRIRIVLETQYAGEEKWHGQVSKSAVLPWKETTVALPFFFQLFDHFIDSIKIWKKGVVK